MSDTLYISVRYTEGAIRLFRETVRSLQTPPYVKFYINSEHCYLGIGPDFTKSQKSHKTPKNLYVDNGKMVVYSKRFCNILYNEMKWDKQLTYRVPGKMTNDNNLAFFDLKKAEILKQRYVMYDLC